MNEFDLVAEYFQPLSEVLFDDDAAVMEVPAGQELVVSTDVANVDVHFRADHNPAFMAQKALRSNLSDLAAMGAQPWRYQLGLSMPKDTEAAWVAAFAGGLKADQEVFGIALSGGDTVSGPLLVSITVFGLVERGKAVKRSGAREGDALLVTGPVGAAVAQDYNHLPTPRLDLLEPLQNYAHAAIDISDGLPQDLAHMARASGLRAVAELPKIPLAASDLPPETLLAGGEDYQLLIACAPEDAAHFPGASVIGHFIGGESVEILGDIGTPMTFISAGWSHF